MKLSRTSGPLSLLALVAIASPPLMADDTGWYMGGNAGQAEANIDRKGVKSNLRGGGFNTTSIDEEKDDFAYKIFGGYQFNRHFALEGGFFDLGDFGYEASTVPAGTQSGDLSVRGLNLDAVGILPLTERFSSIGRIGATYAESRTGYSNTGLAPMPSNNKDRDWNPKIGAGIQYAFTDAWAMRAEFERYLIDETVGFDEDVDVITLGLVYRFAAEVPVVAQAPPRAPYVAPPKPAPAPAPAPPPPPPPTKVAFSADALFDFDKAILKPAGKQALDAFAADLRGTDYDLIRVTGHSDRLGSHAYNMELSERRAEAVRDYLVMSANVPSGKIQTRGVDGNEPVTKPGECRGTGGSRQMIACLQPDRRVEVEVTGTSKR